MSLRKSKQIFIAREKTMLGTLYYKCIGGISSMQEMSRRFNDDKVVENLYFYFGDTKRD